jgi:hypothetical protein
LRDYIKQKDWSFAEGATSVNHVLRLALFQTFRSDLQDLIREHLNREIRIAIPDWKGLLYSLSSFDFLVDEAAKCGASSNGIDYLAKSFGLVKSNESEDRFLASAVREDCQRLFSENFIAFFTGFRQSSKAENITLDSLPSGYVVSKLKSVSGLLSFKDYIFVRRCFIDLFAMILRVGEKQNICIVGDPGIGKSVFAQFTFFALCALDVKCILVSQSSEARIFDQSTIIRELAFKYDPLKYGDYWLLVDGHARQDHLAKACRGVVFASPQRKNYHEFVKQNGTHLYMPTWNLDEVKQMVSDDEMDEEELRSILKSWYHRQQSFIRSLVPLNDQFDLNENPANAAASSTVNASSSSSVLDSPDETRALDPNQSAASESSAPSESVALLSSASSQPYDDNDTDSNETDDLAAIEDDETADGKKLPAVCRH